MIETEHSNETEEQSIESKENEEKLVSNDIKEEQVNDNSEDKDKLVNIEKNQNEENIEKELNLRIGTYQEAPEFIQDNEYIKSGYILNCSTFKKTFKSLFICHNETINIWSHLLGALFFFSLIFYTEFFITNFNSQLTNIREDISLIEKNTECLHTESPNEMDNIYNSIRDIQVSFKIFDKKIVYQESIEKVFSIYNELIKFNYTFEYISSSFNNYFNFIKKEIISLKEKILDLIILDKSKSLQIISNLDKIYDLNLKERQTKKLDRWPLFIIIATIILCLIFSASFHSIGNMNEKYHIILNRFDYGGISLLITGSCYPPYYYFFYYSKKIRYFYLIEISVFGIGTFLYSLTDDFNKPKRRALRGVLFLIFGLCSGIPILHMAFFGDRIEGYGEGIKLLNWYLGGISYVVGALFYILRFPEKKFPIKFDYFGASHQIFHILVFFGALFHFLGSLDAYNYRFKNLTSDIVE